jgi:hypothetical protein
MISLDSVSYALVIAQFPLQDVPHCNQSSAQPAYRPLRPLNEAVRHKFKIVYKTGRVSISVQIRTVAVENEHPHRSMSKSRERKPLIPQLGLRSLNGIAFANRESDGLHDC